MSHVEVEKEKEISELIQLAQEGRLTTIEKVDIFNQVL